MKTPGIPPILAAEYANWHREVVWHFVAQSVVYRLSRPNQGVRFLKVAQADWHPSPHAEAERMRWAVDHLPVPKVLQQGSDGVTTWLVTEALPGRNATDPAWVQDPGRLVRTLARGLRAFHEAPVEKCPFDFRLDKAIALARRRFEEGRIDACRDFHPEHIHLSAGEALERLEGSRPGAEQVVVCHGDYCLPNVLVEGWEATGFLDLGEMGVADRWWDLATATWSLTWNLGPGYEDLFLDEYGVEKDNRRLAFYRLLYDLVS